MTTKRTTKKATTVSRPKKAVTKSSRKPQVKVKGAKPANRRPTKTRSRDPRIPAVGSTLTREFKGKTIKVEVVEGGFKYGDKTFKSISACARHVTGYMISGPVFFRLGEPKRAASKEA